MKQRFKARTGSPMTDGQAKIYGQELSTIAAKHDGTLDVEVVLAEAKEETSPLHDWFTWDDSLAANQWRIHQARMLINTVKVEIIYEDKVYLGPAFVNVSIQEVETETPERVYTPIKQAMEDPVLRKQMIEKALREMNSWIERYHQFTELADIVDALERIRKSIE